MTNYKLIEIAMKELIEMDEAHSGICHLLKNISPEQKDALRISVGHQLVGSIAHADSLLGVAESERSYLLAISAEDYLKRAKQTYFEHVGSQIRYWVGDDYKAITKTEEVAKK